MKKHKRRSKKRQSVKTVLALLEVANTLTQLALLAVEILKLLK